MIFTGYTDNRAFRSLSVIALILAASLAATGQRVAILSPSGTADSAEFARNLREGLLTTMRVDDLDLSRSAANSFKTLKPFNMTTAESRELGVRLGSTHFVLVDAGLMRRSSSEVPEYYEAFGVIYLVSSASGRLIDWDLGSFRGPTEAAARSGFASKVIPGAVERLRSAMAGDTSIEPPNFQPVPDVDDPAFAGLKPPMPYRRKSPAYTPQAFLYDVEATVEIEADIDEDGRVVRSQIVRWAGYGLDNSVTDAVRTMQWRPATLKNTPLPMRVLLRYNFVKREKNDEDPVAN